MTPIKCFRKLKLEFYSEDMGGIRQLIFTAANEMQMVWVSDIMEAFHHKPVLNWEDEYGEG